MNIKIKEILSGKGSEVWAVTPDSTVYEAIEMMASKGVGALAVKSGDRLAGILSERDYARKVILKGKSSRETMVKDIMTTNVVCVSEERKVDECLALMTEKRIRHLPVLDEGKMIGIITIGDVLKTVIRDQENLIGHLEYYIAGKA